MRFHSATASLFGTIFSSPAPLMGHGIDIGAEASSKQAGSKAPIQTRSRAGIQTVFAKTPSL
jgi:hypothetical protein